jgi:hypothetical protein
LASARSADVRPFRRLGAELRCLTAFGRRRRRATFRTRSYRSRWVCVQGLGFVGAAVSVAVASARDARGCPFYARTLESFGMTIATREDTPLAVADLGRPRASYMLSKIYGEALCRYSGLPFTIVRRHNVYGPRIGMAHVVPELLGRAHRSPASARILVFSPGHSRTFCYVGDAVELIVRLALSPLWTASTFDIGSPDGTSIADLTALVVRAVGKRLEVEAGPDRDGSPIPRPDVSLAVSATAYTPSVPLAEGLRRCCAWYRRNDFDVPPVASLNGHDAPLVSELRGLAGMRSSRIKGGGKTRPSQGAVACSG